MKTMIRNLTLTLTAIALLGGAATTRALAGHPAVPAKHRHQPRFDVSIDAATTRTLYSTNGTISRGDTFIITGRIYPGGAIPADGKFNPTNSGSIGTWTCRGVYNFDLAELNAGREPMVFTTQYFQFDDGAMLVTEGTEGVAPSVRVVTGGTARYSGVNGQVFQQFLHFNDTVDVDGMPGFNFLFTFDLK
jgi:hypothetical protein